MKRTSLFIMLAVCYTLLSLPTNAQNVVELMNEVKGNAEYCYGEGADENPQTATDLAINNLCEHLAKKTNSAIEKKKVISKMNKLERKRGSQTRMLVYVKLADFKVTSTSSSSSLEGTSVHPTASQTLNLSNQDGLPLRQQTIGQGSNNVLPVYSNVQITQQSTSLNKQYAQAKDVVDQMRMVKHISAMKKLLATDKEYGMIKDYGTASDVKNSDDVFWWVFRKEPMQFVAVLSPIKTNGMRDNLEAGTEQTLGDYQDSSYGAVWFTLP